MTVYLQSKRSIINISSPTGANPLRVDSVLESLVVSNSSLDQSGLILTTGKLTLYTRPTQAFNESFNPLENPSRWDRGNRIDVEITNGSGQFLRHPRGALRILKRPSRPKPDSPKLEIEIGCDLSLFNYRVPPDDDSQIKLGTSTTRTTILNRLAAKAGLPALIDEVLGFPIDFPLWRLEGSYIDQMGSLAFTAGYVLWIDALRRLRAKRINLEPATVDHTWVVGEDDQVFEPRDDSSETGVEIVRVSGVANKVKPVIDPPPEVSISYASSLALFGEGSATDSNVAEVQKVYQVGSATRKPSITREILKPRGVLMPEAYPGQTSLLPTVEVNFSEFEEDDQGYLRTRQTWYSQPKGATLPEQFPGDVEITQSRRDITTFRYQDEATTGIFTTSLEPKGKVYPSATTNLLTLTLSNSSTQEWKEVNGKWRQVATSRSAGGTTAGGTSISGTNNQPPAPDYYTDEYWSEQKQVKGEYKFPASHGESFAERERAYTFPNGMLVSDEQCRFLAGILGKILHGREFSANWAVAMPDSWLTSYEPLLAVDWEEGSIQGRYIQENEAWALTTTEFAVSVDGICVGIVRDPATAPYLEPVVRESSDFTGTLALGGDLGWFPYAFTGTSDPAMSGGMSIGGYLQQPPGLQGAVILSGQLESEALVPTTNGATATYTGTGATKTVNLSLNGETPDLIWIYARATGGMALVDSVQGTSIAYNSYWERITGQTDLVTAIGVDSFQVGANQSFPNVNQNGDGYVAWALVSDDQFDIVAWTGTGSAQTLTLELAQAPSVAFLMPRTPFTRPWLWLSSFGTTQAIELKQSSPVLRSISLLTQAPTSTQFFLSNNQQVSFSGDTYIGYFLATPTGTYTGNGSSQTINTGATPQRLSIISVVDIAGEGNWIEWVVFDSTRNGSNPRNRGAIISAPYNNFENPESLGDASVDFGATSFTVNDNNYVNENGRTYYWWIF